MHSIENRISQLRTRITRAAADAGRDADEIRLVAISKRKPETDIRAAAASGLKDFGENYLQEAAAKITALSDLDLTWHFVGAIQSNKTTEIARLFQWVHTVDREKIARRLSNSRPESAEPLDVLIQVNLDDEAQKAGVPPAALAELAARIVDLPRLRLRGVMAIPKPSETPGVAFRALQRAFEHSRPSAATHWDTLSMGMTRDFEAAIGEGATIIRVGTAIFGPRDN